MKKTSIYKIALLLIIVSVATVFAVSCSNPDAAEDLHGQGRIPLQSEEDIETDIETEDASGQDTSAETEEEADNQVISFIAAGDNIVHQSVINQAMEEALEQFGDGASEKFYFNGMYSGISDLIAAADIAFVNQEAPIAGALFGYSGHPNFNSPDEVGDTLLSLGFDVINIANNHMLDMDTVYRGTGYKNTISYWKSKDVLMIGGYENSEDYETARILEYNDTTIAFLSYTYDTNSLKLNAGSPECVVPYINDDDIVRHIANAKEEADLVFVSMHWGTENSFTVNSEQKRLAQLIADCGADVIIGHHPHVIQSIEWLEGAGGKSTLCIYSLGNLISTMLDSYNMLGGMVSFDIVKNQSEDGAEKTYSIENVCLEPIVCHYITDVNVLDNQDLPIRFGIELYRLSEYTDELCAVHGSQIYGSFDLSTLYGYATDNISAEFLPEYVLNFDNE